MCHMLTLMDMEYKHSALIRGHNFQEGTVNNWMRLKMNTIPDYKEPESQYPLQMMNLEEKRSKHLVQRQVSTSRLNITCRQKTMQPQRIQHHTMSEHLILANKMILRDKEYRCSVPLTEKMFHHHMVNNLKMTRRHKSQRHRTLSHLIPLDKRNLKDMASMILDCWTMNSYQQYKEYNLLILRLRKILEGKGLQ